MTQLAIIMHNNVDKGDLPLHGMDNEYVFTDMKYLGSRRLANDYYQNVEFFKNFRLLESLYPKAKFILNTRPVEKWLKTWFSFLFKYKGYEESDKARWEEEKSNDWDDHVLNVKGYFSGDKEKKLVEFHIENDNPQKLVDFFAPDFKLDASRWQQHNKTVFS